MQQSLYGLQVDYISRNGHYMVLSAPEGLGREELSAFQVNMLLNNKIPRLLELQIEEHDQSTKLFYQITGKKKLTYMLRSGTITIKQMFELLHAIVEILLDSGNYMLRENGYILQEDYIYCGDHLTDLHLTYVPKQSLPGKSSVPSDLQQLLSRLVQKVSELSGSGYQEVMSCFMDESFNLPTLKTMLLKHMNQLKTSPNGESHTNRSYSLQEEENNSLSWGNHSANQLTEGQTRDTVHAAVPEADKSIIIGEGVNADPGSFFKSYSLDDSEREEQMDLTEADPPKKYKLPAILFGVLGLCLIWRMYLEHDSEAWLMICSGLTLLLGDLIFVAMAIWKPRLKKKQGSFEPAAPIGLSVQLTKQPITDVPVIEKAQRSVPREPEPHLHTRLEAMKEPRPSAEAEFSNENNYYNLLENRTTLLAQRDATVLLKPVPSISSPVPYLEYIREEKHERVEINKGTLIVGRSGQDVDFKHEEIGVSRLHMEIVRDGGSYHIKDLGSRNGTYLNGKPLVPYQLLPLQEGDIVKIAKTEFTFKTG